MKEILACNLKCVLDRTNLYGKCTYKGKTYEVWEISEKVFNALCDIPEETFLKLYPDSMWRYSPGSVLDEPDTMFEVNGHEILAWDKYKEDDMCLYCLNHGCPRTKEDKNDCIPSHKYQSLTDYLCNVVGTSMHGNVCALSKDLALYNKMSMGELFEKYEG